MKKAMLSLLAETFIHPGAGQTSGAVDLPVSREAATEYPFIPGSSLKGAIRQAFAQTEGDDDAEGDGDANEISNEIFGRQEAAGEILIGDGRLLLLPVRRMNGVYKWTTCPHLLERLVRDLNRLGCNECPEVPHGLAKGQFLSAKQPDKKLFLEERTFLLASDEWPSEDWIKAMGRLIAHETISRRLERQLVVLADDDFNWFAQYGLAVQARNVLDEHKQSDNLWYEETLPPDTLMYALLAERSPNSEWLDDLQLFFEDNRWLQVGGNETVGQGWFKVTWLESGT